MKVHCNTATRWLFPKIRGPVFGGYREYKGVYRVYAFPKIKGPFSGVPHSWKVPFEWQLLPYEHFGEFRCILYTDIVVEGQMSQWGYSSFQSLTHPLTSSKRGQCGRFKGGGGLKFEVLQDSTSDNFQSALLSPAADGVQSLYGVGDGGLEHLPSSGHSD